jgi:hypothetical protein
MSALMVTSSVPSVAFAAEDVIISEEAGAEVVAAAEEAEVTVEAVEEEAADTVEVNSQTTETWIYDDTKPITWDYDEKTDSCTATYELKNKDDETADNKKETKTATKVGKVNATCTETSGVEFMITINGVDHKSGKLDVTKPDPATKHGLTEEALEKFTKGEALTEEEMKGSTVTVSEVTTPATHTAGGTTVLTYKCSACKEHYDVTIILPQQDHDWEVVSYEANGNILMKDGKVVLDANGKPQLDDPTYNGFYIVNYKCKDDDSTKSETVTLNATAGSYAVIELSADSNIVSIDDYEVGTHITEPTLKFPLNESKIKLEDCSKKGTYTVKYYTNADAVTPYDVEEFTVNPHHYEVVVNQFATEADAKLCVSTEKGIVNNSCFKTVTYYEVTVCESEKNTCTLKDKTSNGYEVTTGEELNLSQVVNKVAKTVEPSGVHAINTDVQKDIINEYIKAVKADKTKIKTTEELEAEVKAAKAEKYITFVNDTSDCLKAGTVDVEYLCMVCGTVVEKHTVTIDVAAKGHDKPTAWSRINYVEPTCENGGSYDRVKACKRCGEVLESEHKEIERLAHTNEIKVGKDDYLNTKNATNVQVLLTSDSNKVIDYGGRMLDCVGKVYDYDEEVDLDDEVWYRWNMISVGSPDGNVTVKAVTYCDTCGKNEVILNDGKLEVKIDAIQKEDEKGQGGYITLSAIYTHKNTETGKDVEYKSGKLTLAYYSSAIAYAGRVEATEEVINGLHKDADGVYRYYVNGEVAKDTTGVVYYDGAQFYVVNGVLDTTVSGLVQNTEDGKWYMVAKGQVQSQYSGGAQYDGRWFYLTNGVLDTTANGLVAYNGGTFLFAAGQLQNQVNGLWQDFDGTWYFLANGQVQSQHTGVTVYDGAAFYVVDGKLATDYNGTVQYDGATFKVVAGQLYAA